MFLKPKLKTLILGIVLPLAVTHGCDDKATQIAREAADRQAQQNTEMAQLNKEVASGTHQLVAADAQARKEIVGVHHELQAERTRLDSGWNELEGERRQIAGQRRTESMLVPVTSLIGSIVLVAMLLRFCWRTLVAAGNDDTNAQLNELLIHEILPEEGTPLLVSPHSPSLLGHSQADAPSDE
jgi:hypothetical protein